MKKLFISIMLLLLPCVSIAYDVEDYLDKLEWQEKWGRVVGSAINSYIERGESIYPSNFTEEQVTQASTQIHTALHSRLGWQSMSDDIISGFRTECGDDLLDLMVDYYSGVQLTQEDLELISDAYTTCAPVSMSSAMAKVGQAIENFAEEQKSILDDIEKE